MQAPVRLEGWFQNWRYFEAVTTELRAIYDFERIPLRPAAATVLQQIRDAAVPVAVHVRRGDYIRKPKTFLLLDAAHYARARARLETEVAAPSYFVFSDQPELAAQLVAGWPNATLVSGFNELEDFRLMASCRHFLIANSTFSWWAAWLGRAPDKLVIAPSLWLGEGYERKVELDERLPPEWVRV